MPRGRPRTIHISSGDLLAGIHSAWQADIVTLQAEIKQLRCELRKRFPLRPRFQLEREALNLGRILKEVRADRWTPYDLPRFLNRKLSPSEKVVARRVLRELESDGLIELAGEKATEARLTKAGLEQINKF